MPTTSADDRRPPDQTVEITRDNGDPLRITNFRQHLPAAPPVKDRNAFVRASLNHGTNLSEDALHTLGRSLSNAAAAAAAVRQDLTSVEAIGPVEVTMLNTHVMLSELMVLMQPRAGGMPYSVDPPKVRGLVSDSGPEPCIRVSFRDEEHLRGLIRQTVIQTKTYGTDYTDSILSKRVARPVLAHAVEVSFQDGSDSFVATVVRDGITRVVSSWAAQHPHLNRDELASLIAEQMTARREAANQTETIMRARGREQVASEMRSRFASGMAGGQPSEDAIRIGQTFTMPAQLITDIHAGSRIQVRDDEVFDDTVQGIIASIHGEFRPWDGAATQAAAILRAIPRAVHNEDLDSDVADIATGARGLSDMPAVFGEGTPTTALWRAVYLLCWLGHHYEFQGLKRELKDITGASRMTNRTYVSHLASLVDAPWRRAKAHTERQARRAWANGGALPPSFLNTTWDPVPVQDFLDLVEPAMSGDTNARRTLQVAGGVALIADKLLMSNVGSAVESGVVPFRSDVDTVIEGLGSSKRGLCVLAMAANAFDPDRKALNSFTRTELKSLPGHVLKQAYTVPRPSKANPMKPARDRTKTQVALTPWDVVFESDPARGRAAEAERQKEREGAAEETPNDKAERLRRQVTTGLTDAVEDAQLLVTLAHGDGSVDGGPFGSVTTYQTVDTLLRQLQLLVLSNAPDSGEGNPGDDEDGDA